MDHVGSQPDDPDEIDIYDNSCDNPDRAILKCGDPQQNATQNNYI